MKWSFVFLFVLFVNTASGASDFPQISDYAATDSFGYDDEQILIHHQISNAANDKVLYSLWCRGGNDAYLDAMSGKLGINLVGWIGCRFHEGERESELTLIPQELKAAYWFGPGVFRRAEVLQNEGLGAKRTFVFRNLKLVLDFSNIDQQNKRIEFRLTVQNTNQMLDN